MVQVDDKREAILGAVLKLVSEHGFHGTAMAKVAAKAGVSPGTIYHYFENKDELIRELYRTLKKEFCDAQMRDHDPHAPLRVQIRRMWGDMIRWFISHPDKAVFMTQFCSSPYYTAQIEQEIEQYYGPLRECFEAAVKEMIIRDYPPAVYGTLLMDVPNSLAQRQAIGQFELTEELIEEVIESLWLAVRM